MFDLFWSALNLGLFLSFIYFIFKVIRNGFRVLPDRQRLFAGPVMVVGIIALLAGRTSEVPSGKIIGPEFEVESKRAKLSLINTLEIQLVRRKSDGRIDPVLSDSNLSGFVFGRKWRFGGIYEESNQIMAKGSMVYNLMGIEIMSFSRDITIEK